MSAASDRSSDSGLPPAPPSRPRGQWLSAWKRLPLQRRDRPGLAPGSLSARRYRARAYHRPVRAAAVDLDSVLGDTRPLWEAWLEDLARRLRLGPLDLPEDRAAAALELDARAGNWPVLLERFASERAPVFLRPDAATSAALRRLQAAGVRLGAFTDAPEALARVAAAHLGVARRLDALECGGGALERLLARLGRDTVVVGSREELARLAG